VKSRRTAVYPGTFDPITLGHIDIARRATRLFDRLVVAVAASPGKSTLFSHTERIALARDALAEAEIEYVHVVGYDGLLVDCAGLHHSDAIVRGLRATSDFEYELQIALANRDLDPHLETVLLMTDSRYTFLSSSTVKEIKRLGGDVHGLVSPVVGAALDRRFAGGSDPTP